jgi:hypothetical protein
MKKNLRTDAFEIKPAGKISTCPICEYEDGFHVSFQMKNGSHNADVILICPNCHNKFDVGWEVKLSQK